MHLSNPCLFECAAYRSRVQARPRGPENFFCGGEKGRFPGQQDCLDAIAKINPDETYTGNVRFDAGNCTVAKRGNDGSSVPDGISGRDLIGQAADIVTNGCQGSGWCRDSSVNVSPHTLQPSSPSITTANSFR